MSQLKFSLKSWKNILIEGRRAPWAHSLAYTLAQDLKKRYLTEKNQASYADFSQSCRNYAGNRKKPWLLPAF